MKQTSLVILIILGIITYLPSLRAQMFWDDDDFILSNQYVKQTAINKFFTAQAVEGAGKISNYFRPIQFTIYSIAYKVVGANAIFFHGLSIFFHITAAIALFYFLQRFLHSFLETNTLLPLGIAIAFLIHPLQTEAVSYVSGLSDPLVATFGFSTLYYFLKFLQEKTPVSKNIVISYLLFTLTLLSKESGIVFLGLLCIITFIQTLRMGPTRSRISSLLPFCIITFFYLSYHRYVIDVVDIATTFGDSPYTHSILIRLATFLSLLPTYVSLLVFPKTLIYDRDFLIHVSTTPWYLPSIIVAFIVVTTSIILGIQAWSQTKRFQQYLLLLVTLVSFFTVLIPYSGIALINGIMYEHFLYLALPFFFLFIWIVLQEVMPFKLSSRCKNLLLIGIICLCIVRSWIRQSDWQSPITFYTRTLVYVPNSFRILNNLGLAYETQGDDDDAISTFHRAIEVNASIPNPYHNLGTIYLKQKNYSKAEEYFQKAIQTDPNFGYSYSSLLTLYQQTGETEQIKHISEEITKRFK